MPLYTAKFKSKVEPSTSVNETKWKVFAATKLNQTSSFALPAHAGAGSANVDPVAPIIFPAVKVLQRAVVFTTIGNALAHSLLGPGGGGVLIHNLNTAELPTVVKAV